MYRSSQQEFQKIIPEHHSNVSCSTVDHIIIASTKFSWISRGQLQSRK